MVSYSIPAEASKADIEVIARMIHVLYKNIWEKEQISIDWKKVTFFAPVVNFILLIEETRPVMNMFLESEIIFLKYTAFFNIYYKVIGNIMLKQNRKVNKYLSYNALKLLGCLLANPN